MIDTGDDTNLSKKEFTLIKNIFNFIIMVKTLEIQQYGMMEMNMPELQTIDGGIDLVVEGIYAIGDFLHGFANGFGFAFHWTYVN